MGQGTALSHPGVQHTQATSPTRKPGEGAGLPPQGATAPHQWQQMHCGPSSVTVPQGQARHTSSQPQHWLTGRPVHPISHVAASLPGVPIKDTWEPTAPSHNARVRQGQTGQIPCPWGLLGIPVATPARGEFVSGQVPHVRVTYNHSCQDQGEGGVQSKPPER